VLQTPDTSATPSKKRKGKGKAAAEEAHEEETAEPGITKYPVTLRCCCCSMLLLQYSLMKSCRVAVSVHTATVLRC
jgi:hypothetical protein